MEAGEFYVLRCFPYVYINMQAYPSGSVSGPRALLKYVSLMTRSLLTLFFSTIRIAKGSMLCFIALKVLATVPQNDAADEICTVGGDAT